MIRKLIFRNFYPSKQALVFVKLIPRKVLLLHTPIMEFGSGVLSVFFDAPVKQNLNVNNRKLHCKIKEIRTSCKSNSDLHVVY